MRSDPYDWFRDMRKRFESKFQEGAIDECWMWHGSATQFGYGQFRVPWRKAPERAHRVSWIIYNGDIPDDLCVLHRCDNPPCVNPSHLFLGTRADNMRDKVEKGRQGAPPPRTHCPHGHAYDDENTYIKHRKNGTSYKVCRACTREQVRAYQREYQRKRRIRMRANRDSA